MQKDDYGRLIQWFREHPGYKKALIIGNCVITYLFPLSYVALLIAYGIGQKPELARALMVPLDSFLILSVARYLINRPRPYEKFNFEPVISKDTKGKSFPSRHVFSVFVIAVAASLLSPVATAALCLAGLVMAYIRVVGGVHFPRDVIAGALIGVISGAIGLAIWRGLVPA